MLESVESQDELQQAMNDPHSFLKQLLAGAGGEDRASAIAYPVAADAPANKFCFPSRAPEPGCREYAQDKLPQITAWDHLSLRLVR